VLIASTARVAAAAVITFDALADLESVTSQFPGLEFTHTTVLQAGISLNELEFPPHSPSNVVFDDGGALTIRFDTLQASVGGFFTYGTRLTITAFDEGGIAFGQILSSFGSNLALSGDAGSVPNELLSLAFAGIRFVTIEGDPAGGSFALDDLTFTPQASEPAPLPEPASGLLLAIGLALLLTRATRRRACGGSS
jgi:hypothetical protein